MKRRDFLRVGSLSAGNLNGMSVAQRAALSSTQITQLNFQDKPISDKEVKAQ